MKARTHSSLFINFIIIDLYTVIRTGPTPIQPYATYNAMYQALKWADQEKIEKRIRKAVGGVSTGARSTVGVRFEGAGGRLRFGRG